MSFSGLKTAVRTHLLLGEGVRAADADMAASFQAAVVDVLVDRVQAGIAHTGVRRVAIGGGVAANAELRRRLGLLDVELTLPPRSRCTDNAAMIGLVGRMRLVAGQRDGLEATARAAWTPGDPT
jgi:N6-L-threonylcarbamoyladenine synthase